MDSNKWPYSLCVLNELETFYGFVDSTSDALRIFQLCRIGCLGRITRRLHEKERQLIRSGSIFVFDEHESGVKRWTDGRIWSPSRILGNFLVYRELEKKPNRKFISRGNSLMESSRIATVSCSSSYQGEIEELQYSFKTDGLIKKTISAKVDDHIHHLVCYYNRKDFCLGTISPINHPDLIGELRKVSIPDDLILSQSFRKSAFSEENFKRGVNQQKYKGKKLNSSCSIGKKHTSSPTDIFALENACIYELCSCEASLDDPSENMLEECILASFNKIDEIPMIQYDEGKAISSDQFEENSIETHYQNYYLNLDS